MNGVTLLNTTDGKAHLAGRGGVIHILTRTDLRPLERYLKSGTGKIDTFTPREKDTINDYLTQLR